MAVVVTWMLAASVVAVSARPAAGVVGTPDALASNVGGACAEALAIERTFPRFTDVDPDAVHADAIECLAWHGISVGVGDGSRFAPWDPVSRWQMALFMRRAADLLGVPAGSTADQGFVDLGGLNATAVAAVNSMVDVGVFTGVGDDRFNPHGVVSRAQMALLLSKLLAVTPGAPVRVESDGVVTLIGVDADDSFPDMAGWPESFQTAVSALFELGVARGVTGGNFAPSLGVNRAQMASFITRALDHSQLASQPDPAPAPPPPPPGPANTPPAVVNPLADVTARRLGVYTVDLEAPGARVFTDANGDALTYTVTDDDEADTFATITFNGLTRLITITGITVGTVEVTVTASDPSNATATDTFNVTVIADTNTAPTVANPLDDFTARPAGVYSIPLETTGSEVFADVDDDTLSYTATSDNTSIATVAVDATAKALTLTGVTAGTATVTVTANDGHGGSASDDFVVTVEGDANRAPSVANAIDNVNLRARQVTTINLETTGAEVFTDADGDTLSYAITNSDSTKATATFDAATAAITVTGVTQGSTTVTVTADDGHGAFATDTFTVTVAGSENSPPTVVNAISDITARRSGSYTVPLEAPGAAVFNDADNDPLTYTIANTTPATATATLDAATATITVTGVAAGSTTVTVSASDGHGGSVSDDFVVTVGSGVNSAPTVANEIADIAARPSGVYLVPLEADGAAVFNDADGDTLTYTFTNTTPAAATVALDAATATITVVAVAAGTTTITVTAADPHGASVSDSFAVTVTGATNQAPIVANAISNVTLRPQSTHNVALEAESAAVFTDPEGETLSYAVASGDPAKATAALDAATATITVTGVAAGTANVTVTATDPHGGSVTDTFAVTVTATVNNAPTVANPLANLTARPQGRYTVPLETPGRAVFADADGDTLTYSLTNTDPTKATAVLNNAAATVVVTGVATGSTTVTVTAVDGHGGAVSSTFTVTVTATANNAPTIANAIADIAARPSGTYNVALEAQGAAVFADADGDSLTYSITNTDPTKAVATLNPATATITVVGATTGATVIAVTATDPHGGAVTDSFTVTVSGAANRAPTVANAIENLSTRPAGTYTVNLEAEGAAVFSDPDGDTLSYTVANSDPAKATATLDTTTNTVTVTGVAAGTTTVTVTATDPHGATASDPFTVTVTTGANRAPTVANQIDDLTARIQGVYRIALEAQGSAVFSDADGDTLSYAITNSDPTKATATLNTTTNTVTVTGVAAGATTVTVTASDPHGASATDTFTVTVTSTTNTAPTVANRIADLAARIQGVYSVPLEADNAAVFADADGDTLSYAVANSDNTKATATLNAATATVIVTGVAAGATTVTVTATDPHGASITDSFTVNVSRNANNAPVVIDAIANITTRPGASYTVPLEAEGAAVFSDPDGDTLTYTLHNADSTKATATLDAATATITVTGVAAGATTITVTASDGVGGTVDDPFTVTVESTANRTPAVTNPIADFAARPEGVYIVALQTPGAAVFNDPDGDALTYTVTNSDPTKATAVLNPATGWITVTGVAAGATTVTVTASDGHGGSASDAFVVTVRSEANARPTVANPIADLAARPSSVYQVPLEAEGAAVFNDADGDTFTYRVTNSDATKATATLNPATATITVTGVAVGATTVTVTATDGHGASASDTFDVTVRATGNSAPTVANPISDIAARVSSTYQVPLEATGAAVFNDPDGDTLTYSLTNSDSTRATVTLNAATATLTVTGMAAGASTVTVSASDGHGGVVSDSFVVTVRAAANAAPTLANAIPDLAARVSSVYQVPLQATGAAVFADADGDTLSYTLTNSDSTKATAVLNAATATITVTGVAAGATTVTVTASDGHGGSVPDSFVVTVRAAVNAAPTVANPVADLTARRAGSYPVPLEASGAAVFADADGDALTYSVTSSDPSKATAVLNAATATVTVTGVAAGTTTVTVTASDGHGGSVSDDFVVTVVADANTPPTLANAIADLSARRLGVYPLPLEAEGAPVFFDADGDSLTYEVSNSDASKATAVFDATTATITVTGVAVGATTVAITASDPHGGSISDSFVVTVSADANSGPTLANAIADLSARVSGLYPVALEASGAAVFADVDNDKLTYSLTNTDNTKATVTLNAATATITVTGVAVGTTTVTVTASDGHGGSVSDAFVVTVTAAVNNAPTVANQIADLTARRLGVYRVPLEAEGAAVFADADGDTLTYEVAAGDTSKATATLDGADVVVTGVAVGATTVTVTARDPHGGSVADAFVVTVTEASNDAPVVLRPIADLAVRLSGVYVVPLEAPGAEVFFDSDGDTLTYAVSNSDAGKATVTLNESDKTLTITSVATGATTVTVTAGDPHGGAVSDVFVVTVGGATNRPPTVARPIADFTARPAGVYLVPLEAPAGAVFTDADDDDLSYSVANTDDTKATVRLDAASAVLTITGVAVGDATVSVTAHDGHGGSAVDTFTVTLSGSANSAPTVTNPVDDIAAVPDGKYVIELEAADKPVFTDFDGDDLSYVITNTSDATAVATYDLAAQTVTITALVAGTTRVTMTASDGLGGSVSDEFTVTVSGNANRNPGVSNAIGHIQARPLGVYAVELTNPERPVFSDPNNDPLTFSVSNSDQNKATVTLNEQTSTITITGKSQGVTTVLVVADDGHGGTVSDAITVTVGRDANTSPTVANPIANIAARRNGTYTVQLEPDIAAASVFIDGDGDPLIYELQSPAPVTNSASVANTTGPSATASHDAASVSLDSKLRTLTVTARSPGVLNVTVRAEDGIGGSATNTFGVRVVDVPNGAPTLVNPIADVELRVGDAHVVQLETDVAGAVFADPDGDVFSYEVTTTNHAAAPATLDSDAKTFTVTGLAGGTSTVTVTAFDGHGAMVVDTFTVTVNNNTPRLPNPIPDLAVPVGGVTTIRLEPTGGDHVFVDPDGDVLTYAAANSDTSKMSIALHNATRSLTITGVAAGAATVLLHASDGAGGINADEFTVTVSASFDYDADDDGLIEVRNLAQLNAIRWDLDGDATADDAANQAAYVAAFPSAASGWGCPTAGCAGYELVADLTFDSDSDGDVDSADHNGAWWNSGAGWAPIGPIYTAAFDGNAHTISGLRVTPTTATSGDSGGWGLFNTVGRTAAVRNLGLVDVDVRVPRNLAEVGAVAGVINGTASHLWATGTVAAPAARSTAGGLFGEMVRIGGLVPSIRDSYANVEVTAGRMAGGLIGRLSSGDVYLSYAAGAVTAAAEASGADDWMWGGLIGWVQSTNTNGVQRTYATGAVTQANTSAPSWTGGLIGRHDAGRVSQSYATGVVTGTNTANTRTGGVIGGAGTADAVVLADTYWDTNTTTQPTGSGNTTATGVTPTAKTTRELQDDTNSSVAEIGYTGIYADWNLPDWDFGSPTQYPVLISDLNGDRTPTWQEFGDQRQNQAPRVAHPLPDVRLATNQELVIDLDLPGAEVFTDAHNTNLVYTAVSADPTEVAAVISPATARLTLIRANPGDTAITVVATDPQGQAASSTFTVRSTRAIDYDTDSDALIEISSLPQFNAIRWDVDGDGTPTNLERTAGYDTLHRLAFPDPALGMGCPQARCAGYELITDLDFDSNGDGIIDEHDHEGMFWNDGQGWDPIGGQLDNPSPILSAILDGNRHTISNPFMNRLVPGNDERFGLFSVITDAEVRYLGIDNANFRIHDPGNRSHRDAYIGILAGEIRLTDVRSVYSTGTVTVNLNGASEVNPYAGGLIGGVSGRSATIEDSFSTASVAAPLNAGGLVGTYNGFGDHLLRRTYTTGPVSSIQYRRSRSWDLHCLCWGGHVGNLVTSTGTGVVQSGYSTGPFRSHDSTEFNAGGLAQWVSRFSFNSSYSTRHLTGDTSNASLGGLIHNSSSSSAIASYWDTEASGVSSSRLGVGKTTSELQSDTQEMVNATHYAGIYKDWPREDWDFGTSSDYPVLVVDFDGDGVASWQEFGVQRGNFVPIVQHRLHNVEIAPEDTLTVDTSDVFYDRNGHTLTLSVASSDPTVATATLASGSVSVVGVAVGSTVVTVTATDPGGLSAAEGFKVIVLPGTDYDTDDDGLIDVSSLVQLNAIRWDLNGDGAADSPLDAEAFGLAFVDARKGMGCPSTGCTGYELTTHLQFDSDGDSDVDRADHHGLFWNDGEGWQPIGGMYDAVFDGNGHTISDLLIDVEFSDATNFGLFAGLGANGVLRGVGLTDVSVNVELPAPRVGALLGSGTGKVERAWSSGEVTATGPQAYVGGLIGEMLRSDNASIENSFSSAQVKGAQWAGGLVGFTDRIPIYRAYSSGSVNSVDEALEAVRIFGGLVGYGSGLDLEFAYSSAAVRSPGRSVDHGGGLVGRTNHGAIHEGYATGSVSGEESDAALGGLIGSSTTSAQRADADVYWDSQTTGQSTSARGGTARTTSQLQTDTNATVGSSGYSGIYSTWDADAWDFGTSSQYPVLVADFDGDGTATWTEFGDQRGDQAPVVANPLADVSLSAGYTWRAGLQTPGAEAFTDAFNTNLTFTATSDDTSVATLSIDTARSEVLVRAVAAGSASVTVTATDPDGLSASDVFVVTVVAGTDHDTDNDGLIEVSNLAQLNAIRWDLDGDGSADTAEGQAGYLAAFAASSGAGGCPSAGCSGYELTADLSFDSDGDGDTDADDHSGAWWNNGAGWEPIGGFFDATFDGNGHKITGLFVDRRLPEADIGLFAGLGASGVIRGVSLVDADVVSRGRLSKVGGLVGLSRGNMSRVGVTGTVIGAGAGSFVGGVVGQFRPLGSVHPSIELAFSAAEVFGWGRVGGLVGDMGYAGLRRSYSSGPVNGQANTDARVVVVGGAVGYAGDSTVVSQVYASGPVLGAPLGEVHVGSLIGRAHKATSRESLATGPVFGTAPGARVGGAQGSQTGASPEVTVNATVYWDTQAVGLDTSVGGGTPANTSALRSPTNAGVVATDYDGVYSAWDSDAWDFGTQVQYPVLVADFNGDGTATWAEFGDQRPDVTPQVWVPVPERVLGLGELWRIDLDDYFLDRNGDTLTYTVSSTTAAGLTVAHSDGVVSIKATTTGATVDVTVTAADPGGKSVTDTFTVTVGDQPAYDTDADGLIEITRVAQLNVIRYDLDGDGKADDAAWAGEHAVAFTNGVEGLGCPLSGCVGYELAADLHFDANSDHRVDSDDHSGRYWNNGSGWAPIGGTYTAAFNGNGHVITGLTINAGSSATGTGWGLFAALGPTASVRRLGLVDVSISVGVANANIGTIAGVANGVVSHSWASGEITSSAQATLGGLVGTLQTTANSTARIVGSFASVGVSGAGVGGGLAGRVIGGEIVDSYSTGEVTTTTGVTGGEWTQGGVAGFVNDSARLTRVYSKASVKEGTGAALSWTGGLVGRLDGSQAAQSFTAGAVTGTNTAGFATGAVAGSVRPSADDTAGVIAADVYWDTTRSNQTSGVGIDAGDQAKPVAKTTAELQADTNAMVNQADYSGIYADWHLPMWDFGTGSQYPALKTDFDGDGTATWQEFGDQRSNRAPTVANPIPDQAILAGRSRALNLEQSGAEVFVDEFNTELTYSATTSDSRVVTATVDMDTRTLTVLHFQRGTATVTVTATDPDGLSVSDTFAVTDHVAIDYDSDDDGLVEISTLAQLDAIRYDLDASGYSDTGRGGWRTRLYRERHEAAFVGARSGLGCVSSSCLGYELVADLDFDSDGDGDVDADDHNGAWWNDGAGWEPIGRHNLGGGYKGIFEGNGHTISNLYINTGTGDTGRNYGLFEQVLPQDDRREAAIRNVNLENVNITVNSAQTTAGGLAGRLDGGATIERSSVTGTITGAAAPATATSPVGVTVGGLVGSISDGTITDSYSTADVTGTNEVGGLAGDADNTRVLRSYATGDVAANGARLVFAGGLLGSLVMSNPPGANNPSVVDSYAWGAVNDNDIAGAIVGGLIGFSRTARVARSYALGEITASAIAYSGGLLGYTPLGFNFDTLFDHTYWDTLTTRTSTTSGSGTGLTTDAMRANSATGGGPYQHWSATTWDHGTNVQYPVLKVDFNGDGTATWEEFGDQRARKSPVVRDPWPDITLATDQLYQDDPVGYFHDHNGNLIGYQAVTSDPSVVTTNTTRAADGETALLVKAHRPGSAVITVTATDSHGLWAGDTFEVTVTSQVAYDTDNDGLIEVSNLAQLDAIRWDSNGDGLSDSGANITSYAEAFPGHPVGMGCPAGECRGYELVDDLDFDSNNDGEITNVDHDGTWWNDGAGWQPIGNYRALLEGNNHAISNLFINQATGTSGNWGLFAQLAPGARVQHLNLHDADITVARNLANVGVLTGANNATIAHVGVTATINTGTSLATVGGVAGVHRTMPNTTPATIIAAYARATITNNHTAGGLVGEANSAIISTSYANVTLVAPTNPGATTWGGLVGKTTGATIVSNVYTTGTLTAPAVTGTTTGGVIGRQSGTTLTYAYTTAIITGATNTPATPTGAVTGAAQRDGGTSPLITVTVYYTSDTHQGVGSTTHPSRTTPLHKTLAVLQQHTNTTPTTSAHTFHTWSLNLWDHGATNQTPVLKTDHNGDNTATWQEFGTQRP